MPEKVNLGRYLETVVLKALTGGAHCGKGLQVPPKTRAKGLQVPRKPAPFIGTWDKTGYGKKKIH